MDHEGLNTPKIIAPKASDYLDDLDGEDLTEAQKIELLETLFNIMKAFVDIGFDMEPVNKLIAEFEKCTSDSPDLISYKKSEKGSFYE